MIGRLKQEVSEFITGQAGVQKLAEDEYTDMRYPKLIPLMNFHIDRYRISGFGHLMVMHTTTKMGMELLTMSFMPSECVNLPYLLLDAMGMKKKKCVFVEYYGCGNDSLNDGRLRQVYESFMSLPDYPEKEKWYVKERMPYSLIKSGEEEELIKMAVESVEAYLLSVEGTDKDPAYADALKAFRARMINEGNPSDKVLKILLKEDGAKTFMEKVIMPV